MRRKLYLVNEVGSTFYFDYVHNCIIEELDGFGFEFEIDVFVLQQFLICELRSDVHEGNGLHGVFIGFVSCHITSFAGLPF